jgi:hypothetical protein
LDGSSGVVESPTVSLAASESWVLAVRAVVGIPAVTPAASVSRELSSRFGVPSNSIFLGVCERETDLVEFVSSGAYSEGDCLEGSLGNCNNMDNGLSQNSLEVFTFPHSVEKFAPLREISLASMELEVCEVEDHIPLVCCPATVFLGKKGFKSVDRALKLVEDLSRFVGILCDGFEGKLSELFANIIGDNKEKGAGVVSNTGKKGIIELNNLNCSINYDGSACRERVKGRARRDLL